MKNRKITQLFTALLFAIMFLSAGNAFSQSKVETVVMKDCCMMKDGKMMLMTNGKMTRMKKHMMMENGTKCKKNGVCVSKDGTRTRMQNGNCMDKSGKMDNCAVMAPANTKK